MNSNIEHELVEQFRAGNEMAFELIFHKTKGKLKGFLLKVLPIGEDAESILQEIYLKLWSNRKAIKTDKNFETYLFAIARNLVVDVMRKRFQRHKLTPDAKWIDWETLFEWPDWFKKGEESRQEDIHSRQQGITRKTVRLCQPDFLARLRLCPLNNVLRFNYINQKSNL